MNMYAQTKVLCCQKGKFEKQDCSLMWLYWNSLKSMAGVQRVNNGLIFNPQNVLESSWSPLSGQLKMTGEMTGKMMETTGK